MKQRFVLVHAEARARCHAGVDAAEDGAVVKQQEARVYGASGIYEIRHTSSGKSYVGSAASIGRRWLQHKSDLRRGKHKNPKLQNAWNKYGEEAFEFFVLEIVAEDSLLIAREQATIDGRKPEFNICLVAGRERAGVKHSAESIAKMVAAHKGKEISLEHRAKLSAVFAGREFSESTRKKISASKTGVKRRPFSKQARANMSAAAMGRVFSAETRAKLSVAHKARLVAP